MYGGIPNSMKETFKENDEVTGLLCILVEDNAVHGVQRGSLTLYYITSMPLNATIRVVM